MKIKKSLASTVFDTINVSFMIIMSITVLYPVWDMIVVSLSNAEDISYMKLNLFPTRFTLESYRYCIQDVTFYNAFFVSVARTAIGMTIHLVLCFLAGYSLSKYDLPFRRLIMAILIIPMFFSGGLIPSYINIKNLGLLDNFLVYLLPGAFSIFDTIIIRNFITSIPKSLEEAATVDGASFFRICFTIIVPLSKPVLATVSLWSMVAHWNSWFDNLIYVQKESLLTLQFLLRKQLMLSELLSSETMGFALEMGMKANELNSATIRAATTVLVILPIVMVYQFLQKYFVKGIMTGAVKG